MKIIKKILVTPLLIMIKLYQKCISPLFPKSCRFYPTCSAYAIEALKKYGLVKGVLLSVYRVLRCNPWGGHGYDPVPDKFIFVKFKSSNYLENISIYEKY